MLLQRLVADAGQVLADMPPEMYKAKSVRWVIRLTIHGEFIDCLQQTGDGRRGDRGKAMLVPDRVRAGTAPPPILLADNARYTLGLPTGDERAADRHGWYRDLHEAALHDLPEEGLEAVIIFLNAWDDGHVVLPAEVSPEDIVTFRVGSALLVDSPVVQRWWAVNWNGPVDESASGVAATGQCLVCGREGVAIPPYIPLKLKGLPNGQPAGTSLVSINDKAFESFGLSRGETSRVCRDCGETFMQCLNALLADDQRRMVMGPLIYVYWTSGAAGLEPFAWLQHPDADEVGHLITSVLDGKHRVADTTMFNIVSLSASSARAIVRDWIQVTGPQLEASLARWFGLQQQIDAWGAPGRPSGLWRLAAAAYRDARKEMTPDVPSALIRSALLGERLPQGLLPRVIGRSRVDHDPRSKDRPVTYERAMLIRALLASRHGWKAGEMTELETHCADQAYQSGRVMALLEDIQRAALGKVGATVVDKYYGAASAAPASVFGKLIGDAQHHLAKIRRDREGLQVLLQRGLEEALACVESFPRTLTLEKQGMFALGYYHERAALRATKTKKTGTETPDTANEE
jgi:CRISPR-associated protein Csd1